MHKPKFVLENKSYEILWDFEIWIDHSIPTRRPEQVLIQNKKNLSTSEFYCCSWPLSKNARKQKDRQILGSCQRAEKAREHEIDGGANGNWSP